MHAQIFFKCNIKYVFFKHATNCIKNNNCTLVPYTIVYNNFKRRRTFSPLFVLSDLYAMYFLTCPARNPWRVRSSRPPRLQSLHSPRPGGAQADPAHYPAHHCPAPCSGYRTWAAGRLKNNKKQLIRNSCPETADQKKLVRNSSSETAHQK